MIRNLVGSIYARSSIKIAHSVPIQKSANQKHESPVVAMFVTDRDGMSNLYRGPCIDASYQVSDHLAKRFQRKIFLEIDQSETRVACGGHVC
jgi:hypothetical protein